MCAYSSTAVLRDWEAGLWGNHNQRRTVSPDLASIIGQCSQHHHLRRTAALNPYLSNGLLQKAIRLTTSTVGAPHYTLNNHCDVNERYPCRIPLYMFPPNAQVLGKGTGSYQM
jgi:hypothetical protein